MTSFRTGVLVAGLLTAAACRSADPAVDRAPLPDGVVMHLDQSRMERQGREVFVRVENGTNKDLTVEGFTLTSPRLPTITWTGRETIGPTYETDLEVDLPRGRCGGAVEASVTLRYRLGDGPVTLSTGPADDVYGGIALLADRDCAETT